MSNTDYNKVAGGMSGAQVAEAINGNFKNLFDKLVNFENRLKNIEARESGGVSPSSGNDFTVTINALPETTIIEASSTGTTICNIGLSVKCGNKELAYGNDGASQTSYKPSKTTYTIVDTSGTVAGTASFVGNDGKIQATFNKSIHGYYSLTFGITYMNVEYKHAVSFNIVENSSTNDLQVSFAPSAVIINQSVSKISDEYVYDFSTANSTYSIKFGSEDVTNDSNVSVEVLSSSCKNCEGNVNSTTKTVQITGLNKNSTDLVQTYSWTDINGNYHEDAKPTAGCLAIKVTYTDSNSQVHNAIGYLSFVVNNMGIFKESIVGDVHTQISEKTINQLNSEGKLVTETTKTAIVQEASGLTLSAVKTDMDKTIDSKITQTANKVETCVSDIRGLESRLTVCESGITTNARDISGNTSTIEQTGNRISMLVSGLTKTGIEIDEDSTSGGTITLQGDRVYVKNGDDVAALFESGKIKADYLDADEIVTKALTGKTITAEELHVTGTTGSVDIDGKTGALSATSATIQGDFVSKNASTWIEYEMNAKKGYFEMRGPTGVDDMDRTKPDTGATKVTLARIFQNPDPDSLASVASLELMKGNTRKIYIDPIDGFCIQNVYNGGSEMDVSRTLTISAYGITYYDDNKNRYSKNWEDLLS